ncbi:hypothetical protein TWF788_007692 [Orbilia oligospora]|uniref:Peptidase A1 domain-containing protein n=1 Tax=Orbilia oligospora TaxID=2813651 RepID=A0A7C8TTJ5_ORBOL|nr:hypothetical protein TWF788_007692 [Orbilia oligospora]
MGNYGTWHWRTPLFVCAIFGVTIFYCAWHGRTEDLSSQDSLDRDPILRPAYLFQKDNLKIFNGDETAMTIVPRAQAGETLPNGTSTERGDTTKSALPLATSLKPTVAIGSLVSIKTTSLAQISSADGISKTKPGTWENPDADVRVGHGFQMMEDFWNETLRQYFIEVRIGITEDKIMTKEALLLDTGEITWIVRDERVKRNKGPVSSSDTLHATAKRPTATPTTTETSQFDISAMHSETRHPVKISGSVYNTSSIINFGAVTLSDLNISIFADTDDQNITQYSSLGIGSTNSTFLTMLTSKNIINSPSFGLHFTGSEGKHKGSGPIIFGGVDIGKFSVLNLKTYRLHESGDSSIPAPRELNISIFTNESGPPVACGFADGLVEFDFGDSFLRLLGNQIESIKAALRGAQFAVEFEGEGNSDIFLKDLPPLGLGLDLSFSTNGKIFLELRDIVAYSESRTSKYKYQLMVKSHDTVVLGNPFFRAVYAFLDYRNNEISFAPIRRGVTEQHVVEVFESLSDPTTILRNINPANIPFAGFKPTGCTTYITNGEPGPPTDTTLPEKSPQPVIFNALAVSFGGLWVGTSAALLLVLLRYRRLQNHDALTASQSRPRRRRSRRAGDPVSEPFLPGSYRRRVGDRVRDSDGNSV